LSALLGISIAAFELSEQLAAAYLFRTQAILAEAEAKSP
jgi:hypothetical protein